MNTTTASPSALSFRTGPKRLAVAYQPLAITCRGSLDAAKAHWSPSLCDPAPGGPCLTRTTYDRIAHLYDLLELPFEQR